MPSDDTLAQLALGFAPSFGVTMAVLITVLIYTVTRYEAVEHDLIGAIRDTSNELIQFIHQDRTAVGEHFDRDATRSNQFLDVVYGVSDSSIASELPSQAEWIQNTRDIRNHTLSKRRSSTTNPDELFPSDRILSFLSEVERGLMRIQRLRDQGNSAKFILVAFAGAAMGLLVILSTATVSQMRYGEGIPGSWNIFAVALMFGLTILVIGSTMFTIVNLLATRKIL